MQNFIDLFGRVLIRVVGWGSPVTTVLRYLFPLLAIAILVRCGISLLGFRKEPEVWGHIAFEDGSRLPVTHWENTIGRTRRNDIQMNFENIYKQHAVLTRYDDGSWTIGDVGGRGGIAVNGETGAVICSFPEGVKAPAIPIPYAQESMHGFEYALAGLMIAEGMTEEGMAVVTAVRDRYRGYNRNPFNEIECGSNYARSMASFALLPLFSGFSFDMTKGRLGFDPVLPGDFRAPWFLDCAWGVFERKDGTVVLTIEDGALPLQTLTLPFLKNVRAVAVDGKEIPFTFSDGRLSVEETVRKELTVLP